MVILDITMEGTVSQIFYLGPSFCFILACNRISLIPFNSLQSQLLFDILCFKIDQVAMKLSTKT